MAKAHIHKYHLVNLTRDPNKNPYWVYACSLPHCTHYLVLELVDGKMCLCNKCEQPFQIRWSKVVKNGWKKLLVKPVCEACSKKKVKQDTEFVSGIEKLMNEIVPGGV